MLNMYQKSYYSEQFSVYVLCIVFFSFFRFPFARVRK